MQRVQRPQVCLDKPRLRREIGEKAEEASTLSNLGRVYGDLGRTRVDPVPVERPVEPVGEQVVDLTSVSRAEEEPEPVASLQATEASPIAGSESSGELDDEDRSLRELFWGED